MQTMLPMVIAPMVVVEVLEIPRDKWVRGNFIEFNDEKVETGRCALGWDMKRRGLDPLKYDDYTGLYGRHSSGEPLASEIVTANDRLQGERREQRLKELFAEIGIEVRFI